MDLVRLVAKGFQNVEFGRPGIVDRKQPEGRPCASALRQLGGDLEIAVGLPERGLGRDHARSEGVVLGGTAGLLDGAGADDQLAVLERKRIVAERRLLFDARESLEVGVDIDLLLAVGGQRVGTVAPPFELGAPGAAAIGKPVEGIEVVDEGAVHGALVGGEREVIRGKGRSLGVVEGEGGAVAEVEDGLAADLVEGGRHGGEILEGKTRQRHLVAVGGPEIHDHVGTLALAYDKGVAASATGQHVVAASAVDEIAAVIAVDDIVEVVAARRGRLRAQAARDSRPRATW